MRINITKDRNSQIVLVKIKNLSSASKEALEEGFEKMGSGLVRTLQNSILNEEKFGREYRVSGKSGVKRLHRASAAGQTPALLRGEYYEKAFSKSHGANGLEFGDEAPHAEYLELGTEKMLPRPGLGNAISSSVRNNRLYLEESLDKGFKS